MLSLHATMQSKSGAPALRWSHPTKPMPRVFNRLTSLSYRAQVFIIFPQSHLVSLEDDRNEYARKHLESESIKRSPHWLEKRAGDFDCGHHCDGDGESTDAG